MNTFLTCFDQVINPSLLHPRNSLDAEQGCKEIIFVGNGPMRIVKTDNDSIKLFPLISHKEGHHCIADYCIFTEDNIIICDLKSGESYSARKQIENTRFLIDYLLKFIKYHYKLYKAPPTIHYAVFSGRVSKGLSKPSKPAKVINRGFEYYELGCGGRYKLKDLC